MILYNTETGRIKQRILCCRKYIVIFGLSDLFIEQLLALAAECRLLKFSFRAWQKYCILSLLSLGRFSEGILTNISSKKNAFVWVFTLTILWLSAILKLDFLKSPGKSGSARPPRGMKLGNYYYLVVVLTEVGYTEILLVAITEEFWFKFLDFHCRFNDSYLYIISLILGLIPCSKKRKERRGRSSLLLNFTKLKVRYSASKSGIFNILPVTSRNFKIW